MTDAMIRSMTKLLRFGRSAPLRLSTPAAALPPTPHRLPGFK
jgi:predicted phage tail protein